MQSWENKKLITGQYTPSAWVLSTGYWEMNTRTKIIWIQFKSYQQYNDSQAIEITGPYVKYA